MRRSKQLVFLIAALVSLFSVAIVAADGTENLGAPGIAISDGTDVITAGTGLLSQPGTIDINIPAGASIEQVLLYWEGQYETTNDDTITADGNSVTGTLIGGPTVFFGDVKSETYRADVTGLGLVTNGANSVSVSGMDFDFANNGAGLLVIVDDGTDQSIELRDGNDLAYINFASPLDTTVAQTFTFDAADADRTATLDMFFSSVAGTTSAFGFRPSDIVVESGGVVTSYPNLLDSIDEDEWDTIEITANVPAGATSLTVQALSADDGSGRKPASFAWNAAALTLPDPELPAFARITGGGWRVTGEDGTEVRSSQGLTLHCDITLSNNLQVNWRDGGSNKWHIDKFVDAAFCEDDPNFTPEPPVAPADTYIGLDVGRLNNVDGSVACFILEDHGETSGDPDGPDQALLRIWDVGFDPGITADELDDPGFDCRASTSDPTTDPNTVLWVPLSDVNGNLQFHFDQPHKGNGNK